MNSEKKGYTATITLTLQLRKGTEKQASRQHKDQQEQQTQEILKKHPKRSVLTCIYLNKEIEKHYYKIASQS